MCPVSTPSCCARGCIAWMARAAGGFTYSRTRSRAPGPLGDRRGDRDTGNLKTVRKGQLEDANQDRDDDVCLYDSTLCAPVAGRHLYVHVCLCVHSALCALCSKSLHAHRPRLLSGRGHRFDETLRILGAGSTGRMGAVSGIDSSLCSGRTVRRS